jgi:hypothetical protein
VNTRELLVNLDDAPEATLSDVLAAMSDYGVRDYEGDNPELRALWAGVLHECRELRSLVDEFMGLLAKEAYAKR